MNLDLLNSFLSGAISLGFGAVSFFFLTFWRRSAIGLYGFFALAFALLAIERLVLLFADAYGEFRAYVYSIRLCAFLVILLGIAVQNRRQQSS